MNENGMCPMVAPRWKVMVPVSVKKNIFSVGGLSFEKYRFAVVIGCTSFV